MKAPRQPVDKGPPALGLLEEAVHLLRFAPARIRSFYLTGTVPFLLGFLYFWSDMSRNVRADTHVIEASLGMALLFIWMKAWQSAAASELHAHCARAPRLPWTRARIRRLLYIQTVWQPTKLFVLPLAALLTLPFAAACAFYHQLAISGDGTLPTREAVRRARAAATPWPARNFLAILFINSVGLFIFLNIYVLGAFLPELLRLFTGLETAASQNPFAFIFSSTFFAAALAGAHLFLFAFTSAFYVVRCFHTQSVRDGRDLLSGLDLASGARRAGRAAIAALVLVALHLPVPAHAALVSPAAPPPARSVAPDQLNRSLRDVLERREFAWRLPRERELNGRPATPEGPIGRFVRSIQDGIKRFVEWIREWYNRARDWWDRVTRRGERSLPSGAFGGGGAPAVQSLLYVLLALVIVAAGLVAFRQWRRRSRVTNTAVAAAPPAAPVADLESEDVLASQLPEEEWLLLARELAAKGEYRLALRAWFLATLAGLAARGALSIARHKSNHDYARELQRRNRDRVEWPAAFAESVRTFERCWYGRHAADSSALEVIHAQHDILLRAPASPGAPPPLAPPVAA